MGFFLLLLLASVCLGTQNNNKGGGKKVVNTPRPAPVTDDSSGLEDSGVDSGFVGDGSINADVVPCTRNSDCDAVPHKPICNRLELVCTQIFPFVPKPTLGVSYTDGHAEVIDTAWANGEPTGTSKSNGLYDGSESSSSSSDTSVGLGPGGAVAQPVFFATPVTFTYFGGRLISNLEIVNILWGSGTYRSEVSNNSDNGWSMHTFYREIVKSDYLNFLTEYNSDIIAGTTDQQQIGKGTYRGQFKLSLTSAGTPVNNVVKDAAIQKELIAQINAGNIPSPSVINGNPNSIYMLHFPQGITINYSGYLSCSYFCAYHGTVQLPGTSVLIYYAVMPDFSGQCSQGCGPSTLFNNQMSTASHEIIEALTDAEVGLATSIGPPLAWYDKSNGGEIGDICNQVQGSFKGSDGNTYTVQKGWSNIASACVMTPQLSVVTPPTTTPPITATPTDSPTANPVVIPTTPTPTSTRVSTPTPSSTPVLVIKNGDFETGTLNSWSITAGTATVTKSSTVINGVPKPVLVGSFSLLVGTSNAKSSTATVTQTFTIPSTATTLSFNYFRVCKGSSQNDWTTVFLTDKTNKNVVTRVVAQACVTDSSVQTSSTSIKNLAGHNVMLSINIRGDGKVQSFSIFDSFQIS